MKKVPTAGVLIVGLAAIGLLVNKWIRGDVGYVAVIVIAVVVVFVAIVLVLMLMAKKGDGAASAIQASGDWRLTTPGYAMTSGWTQPGEVLAGRKIVFAAGPVGIAIFDAKQTPATQLLVLSWPEIGQLQVGSAELMGQTQPAIVVGTSRGVLHLIALTEKTLGVANTSVEGTTSLLNQLQAVRVG